MDTVYFNDPATIWLLVGIGLIISEFAIPGLLVIFFGLGALITSAFCWMFEISLFIQIVIFLGSSVMLLLLLRKYIHTKFFEKGVEQKDLTFEEEFIGQTATALTDFTAGSSGKIEFKGTQWTATSNEIIIKDKLVTIIEKNNLTLTIKNKQND